MKINLIMHVKFSGNHGNYSINIIILLFLLASEKSWMNCPVGILSCGPTVVHSYSISYFMDEAIYLARIHAFG